MRARQDYSGRPFGRITLDEPVPGKPGYWRGRCACGNPVEKRLDNLKRPGDHTCGRCTATAPRLTEEEVRGKLTTLEEDIRRLRQETARLGEPAVSPQSASPAAHAIASTEGQAIWSYIDEMKDWLKHEIGARLKALEARLAGVQSLGDEVANLRRGLAGRDEQLAAVREELKGVQQRIAQDQAPVADTRSACSAAVNARNAPDASKSVEHAHKTPAANGCQSEAHPFEQQTRLPDHAIAFRPDSEKVYPVRPGHCLHQYFYYWQTAEGYELANTLGGKKLFLGFYDTTAEVRQAIADHLYEKGYMPQVIEDLFDPRA